ncbi:MAG: SprB repeat-containing protein, partial [Bacteroidia bacterium]
MRKQYYIISLLVIFFNITADLIASHVVGGTLTYVYNGGSSYTVTLKLYRDCKPGTAGFDPSITITVLGNNGAKFTPTRNITIPLGTVTSIPSTLDPCAIPPSPIPCVEEGIYTKTVNNLPPNAGGYHLYWQREARNISILNTNVNPNSCTGNCTIIGCPCVGSSFYAYIPGFPVKWGEDFNLANSTTVDNGATSWTRSLGNPSPGDASVQNNTFQITGASNAKAKWTSQSISVSSCSSFNLNVDLSETGTLDPTDSIYVFYRINGGPQILFPTNGQLADDFTNAVASATGLVGTSVQIIIQVRFAAGSTSSKIYNFDNVLVSCNSFTNNSSPTFDLFPPVFICAGQQFTFDHSATDIDGDQLTYSFYTPFDGDNAVGGPKDPTFPNGNVISFQPIVWQPGYSATNPLGGAPPTLNTSTGLLTGIANTIGQFVVGVSVKETRNGVVLSQTLRDFQFNVVDCPIPPPPTAGPDISINQGCTAQISAGGFDPTTVVWNSIAPGPLGAYNSYLSCTSGCSNPVASQMPGAPPYVDYQVCGLSNSCSPSNNCDIVRVNFNPPLTVAINPSNPILCPNQTSINITANAGGGTPPYTYLWNNINPAQSITVGTGTYTVKLSDASGCPPAFASVNVTSSLITANAGADKTVCKQSPVTTLNGSVTVATGGTWSGGGGSFSPNNTTLSGATYTPSPTELANGYVNLILTTTGTGTCAPVSDTVRINYVNFDGVVATTTSPVNCFGGSDGSATINVSGGASPYSFSWNTVPANTTPTISNLSIGTYTVEIKNGLGCTTTATATITQPTPIALNTLVTDATCFGESNGSVSVTASGGNGPYTYFWQPGNQTTSSILNKTIGTYTVTVTDAKQCVNTGVYTINQPSPIAISISKSDVSCYNYSNGTATATVGGGTPPYIYNWSSGGTSPTATNLTANTYTLTVKDNKNCIGTNIVSITQPTKINVNINSSPETCNNLNNGIANASVTGGSAPYGYLWQPGAYTTSNISNLSAGTYTLSVTDAKNCTSVSNTTVTEPNPLSINFINQSNVSCFGGNDGTITANAVGGTPNYTFSWTPGGATTATLKNIIAGTYTVTITDSKGCVVTNSVTISQPQQLTAITSSTNETCDYLNNGTASVVASGGTPGYSYVWFPDLQTSANINALKAATYSVTITDAKGCTANASATITQPNPISLNLTSSNVKCYAGNDGTASVNPNGGNSPYSYMWSPGNNTTQNISNLSAGAYSVTVTDNSGCATNGQVTISQPIALAALYSKTNKTCSNLNDGTATAIPNGGTPGYTYLWQPGALTNATINNLNIGSYTLTITDTNGCDASSIVNITEPLPVTVSFTSQIDVSCFGGNDGYVAAAPMGGTPNYTYLWAPGGYTTAGISNLSAGNYSITVTDVNGCIANNNISINQPQQLTAITSSTNETCDYLNNGTASVVASGGTPGYSYVWFPDLQTSANINALKAATYSVTITDAKGCTANASATITQPNPISLNLTSSNVKCYAGNDGTASVNPNGGNSPYSYMW